MREKTIGKDVKDWCKAKGFWCLKIHGSQYMPRGLPDFLVIVDGGRAWFIETKKPKGTVEKWQARMQNTLRGAGALVCVARSLDDVKAFYWQHIDDSF